jgi:hypothetical protein
MSSPARTAGLHRDSGSKGGAEDDLNLERAEPLDKSTLGDYVRRKSIARDAHLAPAEMCGTTLSNSSREIGA